MSGNPARRRYPSQDAPAQWWPPGPQGARHPLSGNHPPDSVRQPRGESVPAKPAGQRRRHSCEPTPRGRRHPEPSKHCGSQVFMRRSATCKDLAEAKDAPSSPKENDGAAGVSTQHCNNKRAAFKNIHDLFQSGKAEAKEACAKLQRSFENAAGAPSGKDEAKLQSKRIIGHHQAAGKLFHRGLHVGDVGGSGVFDFHPTCQGRKARSAPRRKSNAGALLRGEASPPTMASEEFQGAYEATYEGAAGIPLGGWADARYSSTTTWH